MTTATDATFNDAALKFIADVQERTLEANRTFAELVKSQTSSLPSWLQVPESLSPETFVKQGFEFGSKVLEADQKFALELIGLWSAKPTAAKPAK